MGLSRCAHARRLAIRAEHIAVERLRARRPGSASFRTEWSEGSVGTDVRELSLVPSCVIGAEIICARHLQESLRGVTKG